MSTAANAAAPFPLRDLPYELLEQIFRILVDETPVQDRFIGFVPRTNPRRKRLDGIKELYLCRHDNEGRPNWISEWFPEAQTFWQDSKLKGVLGDVLRRCGAEWWLCRDFLDLNLPLRVYKDDFYPVIFMKFAISAVIACVPQQAARARIFLEYFNLASMNWLMLGSGRTVIERAFPGASIPITDPGRNTNPNLPDAIPPYNDDQLRRIRPPGPRSPHLSALLHGNNARHTFFGREATAEILDMLEQYMTPAMAVVRLNNMSTMVHTEALEEFKGLLKRKPRRPRPRFQLILSILPEFNGIMHTVCRTMGTGASSVRHFNRPPGDPERWGVNMCVAIPKGCSCAVPTPNPLPGKYLAMWTEHAIARWRADPKSARLLNTYDPQVHGRHPVPLWLDIQPYDRIPWTGNDRFPGKDWVTVFEERTAEYGIPHPSEVDYSELPDGDHEYLLTALSIFKETWRNIGENFTPNPSLVPPVTVSNWPGETRDHFTKFARCNYDLGNAFGFLRPRQRTGKHMDRYVDRPKNPWFKVWKPLPHLLYLYEIGNRDYEVMSGHESELLRV